MLKHGDLCWHLGMNCKVVEITSPLVNSVSRAEGREMVLVEFEADGRNRFVPLAEVKLRQRQSEHSVSGKCGRSTRPAALTLFFGRS
jgi:hypothetical protein